MAFIFPCQVYPVTTGGFNLGVGCCSTLRFCLSTFLFNVHNTLSDRKFFIGDTDISQCQKFGAVQGEVQLYFTPRFLGLEPPLIFFTCSILPVLYHLCSDAAAPFGRRSRRVGPRRETGRRFLRDIICNGGAGRGNINANVGSRGRRLCAILHCGYDVTNDASNYVNSDEACRASVGSQRLHSAMETRHNAGLD